MSQLLGMNKDRLYIGFYKRNRVDANDAKYHTALLLFPKTMKEGDVVNRYHVKNEIIDAKIRWVFSNSERDKPRTFKLVSIVYLGKVLSKRKVLEDALKTVPIAQDDPEWRCRHWVWSAVQLLANQTILSLTTEALVKKPEQLWNVGMAFSDEVLERDPYLSDLPACDANGKEISCGIGSYKKN